MNIELWRQRKKQLHLTLDDIAEQSGVSRRTVARLFSKTAEHNNPERITVDAIERVLGLSSKPDQAPTPPLTDTQKRLLNAFDGLIPAMQDYVIEMVEKLVDSQPASASAKIQKKA